MNVAEPNGRMLEQKRQVQAIVLGERTRGGPASATSPVIEIATREPAPPVAKSIAVNIPNSFDRQVLPSTQPVKPQAANAADISSLGNQPWSPASSVRSAVDRIVYFATNRSQIKAADAAADPNATTAPAAAASSTIAQGSIRFGTAANSELTYGSCVVNFPVRFHKRGNVEQPGWWEARDLEKVFAVETAKLLDKRDFSRSFAPGDVLLLVHGFNTSFDDCVLRVAQLQYDLEFPGAAVAFSWPSAASIGGYQQDSETSAKSVSALADLLRTLIDRNAAAAQAGGKPPKLHVIAHSMGNRILLNALYQLDEAGYFKPDSKPLGQVILAAPDVGAQMFNNLIPFATDYAEQVTYYYCHADTALAASRQINYYEPVGLLPVFEAGLRTINADSTDTSFIGHGYYASSPRVLLDMQLLVNAGLDPDHRMPPLATRTKLFGHLHWSFSGGSIVAVDAKP